MDRVLIDYFLRVKETPSHLSAMSETSESVVILGASNKPERYAYKAFVTLLKYGHEPIPVHPDVSEIEGVPVFR